MQVIIPAAGEGTRLYPQTHTKPKPMVRIAGEPIIGHILGGLPAERVSEVVVVIGGPMKSQIVEYTGAAYGDTLDLTYVEQETPEGLGHSIHQARDVVDPDEDLVIVLGDMLFEKGYEAFIDAHDRTNDVDGNIGVTEVSEPRNYGVVETGPDGHVVDVVEKPEDPPTNLAITGVYVVRNTSLLFEALDHLVANDVRGAGGEYQLTDALSWMIDAGADLDTFGVSEWYDCGRPATLLEANRVLLNQLDTNETAMRNRTVIIQPVDLGDDVYIESSVIGPRVSVDEGTTITDSIVRDSIVGRGSDLDGINVEESIIGDNADIDGQITRLNVGDNSSLGF